MTSENWKVLLDEEPENELIHFSFAKALMDERLWLQAANEFRVLVKANAEYVIAWAFLARCLLEAGEKAEALKTAEHAMPLALKFNHEVPIEELESILEELHSDF